MKTFDIYSEKKKKLCGGIFQTPQSTAFQNIFVKSFRAQFRALSKMSSNLEPGPKRSGFLPGLCAKLL